MNTYYRIKWTSGSKQSVWLQADGSVAVWINHASKFSTVGEALLALSKVVSRDARDFVLERVTQQPAVERRRLLGLHDEAPADGQVYYAVAVPPEGSGYCGGFACDDDGGGSSSNILDAMLFDAFGSAILCAIAYSHTRYCPIVRVVVEMGEPTEKVEEVV